MSKPGQPHNTGGPNLPAHLLHQPPLCLPRLVDGLRVGVQVPPQVGCDMRRGSGGEGHPAATLFWKAQSPGQELKKTASNNDEGVRAGHQSRLRKTEQQLINPLWSVRIRPQCVLADSS